MNFKAAPQSYTWPGDTYSLGHMVTGHLKIGEKKQKNPKSRNFALLESFHPEPKELECTGTTPFNAGKKTSQGSSECPAANPGKSEEMKKYPKKPAQGVLRFMPYLEVG